MPCTTAAKYAFQRFFEISPIHCCSYIGFRAFLYEGIFWLIALSVCAGFCISQIANLSQTYAQEKTSISLDQQRNNSMRYDNVAVCIDIDRLAIMTAISESFREEEFNATLKVFSKSLDQLA